MSHCTCIAGDPVWCFTIEDNAKDLAWNIYDRLRELGKLQECLDVTVANVDGTDVRYSARKEGNPFKQVKMLV